MKKNICKKLLMGAALTVTALAFAGCGKTDYIGEITVFNYGEYCDPEVLEDFEKETGIKVNYEEFTTPEAMYTKYKNGAVDYDVICSTDYMIEKMIANDDLEPIDWDTMPNAKNLNKTYMELAEDFDPGNTYSMPYYWGTLGILYDPAKTNEEITSWGSLFDDKYAGQLIMQNSVRDSIGVALKYQGFSINSTNKDELELAKNLLLEQKPKVQSYLVDEARDEMIAGNATIALVYSGEATVAQQYNEELKYVVPKEGSNIWMDSWVIPKSCKNKEYAQKFLDYLCDADVAMTNYEYICYSPANQAVYDNLDADAKADTTIFPDEEILKKCEFYHAMDEDMTNYYSELWKSIKAD